MASTEIWINATPLGNLPDEITSKAIRAEKDIASNDEYGYHCERYRVHFENGFGLSFIRGTYTYGGEENLWEAATITNGGGPTYDTPITDDVIGWQSDDDVKGLLKAASELTYASVAEHVRTQAVRQAYEDVSEALSRLAEVSGYDLEHVRQELSAVMMSDVPEGD